MCKCEELSTAKATRFSSRSPPGRSNRTVEYAVVIYAFVRKYVRFYKFVDVSKVGSVSAGSLSEARSSRLQHAVSKSRRQQCQQWRQAVSVVEIDRRPTTETRDNKSAFFAPAHRGGIGGRGYAKIDNGALVR